MDLRTQLMTAILKEAGEVSQVEEPLWSHRTSQARTAITSGRPQSFASIYSFLVYFRAFYSSTRKR
jgi:hypothetical protein